jgi:uncharacterized protein YktA (UPF0223 family)
MAREMLKLRKGDSAIKIKADGQVELAGVQDKSMVDDNGNISPVILFAAAWAKKDQNLINHLIDNFRNCVREGYFGTNAQDDYKRMEAIVKTKQEEKEVLEKLDEMHKDIKDVGKLTIEEGVENETK